MTEVVKLGNYAILNVNGVSSEHRITKVTVYGKIDFRGSEIPIYFNETKKKFCIEGFEKADKNIKIEFEKPKVAWTSMPKISISDTINTRTYDKNEAPLNVGIQPQLMAVHDDLKNIDTAALGNATLEQLQERYGKSIIPDTMIQLFNTTPILYQTIHLLKMFEPLNNSREIQTKFQEAFKINYAFIATIPDNDWDAIFNFYHLVKDKLYNS